MATEDPAPDGAPQGNPPPWWAVVAGVLLVAVGATISLLSRGAEENTAVGSTTTVGNITTTEPGAQETGTGIPPIDGCTLLMEAEVDQALGGVGEADGRTTYDFIMPSGNETCLWEPLLNGEQVEGLSAGVGPGDPNDFAENAELEGISGSPVTGVGDLAVWFATDTGGTISVAQTTPLGYLFLRVGVRRADVDDATRLQAAKDLAVEAMRRAVYGPDPEPAKVKLCDLVTDAEAEQVLGPYRDAHPATLDEVMTIGSEAPVDLSKPGDAVCTKLILAEYYVRTEQGSPDDFAPGATMEGVAAEPVSVVGDEAVWFGGVLATRAFEGPHENGVLSIHQDDYYFRIELALPDVDPADELEIAIGLAAKALGRLPGGETLTILQPEPLDLSNASYADNLLAKDADGEWTLGEGLVATLKLFAGEAEPTDVLRQPQLLDDSGTDIIAMAEEYLQTGPDVAAKAEIDRLLGILDFRATEIREPSASYGAYMTALAWDGPVAIATQECAAQSASEPEYVSFEAYNPTGTTPGKAVVFFPEQPGGQGGWTAIHGSWALDATHKAIDVYGASLMPCVDVLLSSHGGPQSFVLNTSATGVCGVVLNTGMKALSEFQFKQVIAYDIAFCFMSQRFPALSTTGSYSSRRWWNHAYAWFLSNWVYPAYDCPSGGRCDLEWKWASELAGQETKLGMMHRTNGNWMFFRYINEQEGQDAVDDVIDSLPPGGDISSDEDAIAGLPGMDQFFHRFIEALTDQAVTDTGGGSVPYSPPSDEILIRGPLTVAHSPTRFGTTRWHVVIPGGQFACIEQENDGNIIASWRPGGPGGAGVAGSWMEMPDKDSFSGDFIVVITTVDEGAHQVFRVKDVSDDPECEDEPEPTPSPPTRGGDAGCSFCGYTDYFKSDEGQIPPWLHNVLPPLSEAIVID